MGYGTDNKSPKVNSDNEPSKSGKDSKQSIGSEDGAGASTKFRTSNDPYDMDSTSFDPDSYMQRLIKDNSLAALMNHEGNVVRQIHSLDSDMQTLVYENYNKFIAATDTIKKMRVDFRTTDDDMAELEDKMAAITKQSARVSESLRDRRQRTAQLAATHGLLKKMEFLFELPEKLKECIADKDYALGVKYYVRAQKVLDQYEHMPSFSGIQTDCDEIMVQLRSGLRTQLKESGGETKMSPQEMSNCVYLLLLLNTPASELCDDYLESSKVKLKDSLSVLERQVILAKRPGSSNVSLNEGDEGNTGEDGDKKFDDTMDILEFVTHGCDHFLSDACLVIHSYNETFINGNIDSGQGKIMSSPQNADEFEVRNKIDAAMATEKLLDFISELITIFFEHVKSRTCLENNLNETAILARALDRFHRRLQAMSRLLPQKNAKRQNSAAPKTDFGRDALNLVLEASMNQCNTTFERLKADFQDSLLDARKTLVTPSSKRLSSMSAGGNDHELDSGQDLKNLNSKILTELSEKMRNRLSNLEYFIDPELSYAVKNYYRTKFCRSFVREGIVVAYFKYILQISEEFCEEKSDKNAPPPILLLLLSRSCLDLQSSVVQNLVGYVDEHFLIDDTSGGLTTVSKLKEEFRNMASRLLNHYVHRQGQVLSTMLRKSVETRDWLNTVEPRTVRAVMKRVVEEVTSIDRQVAKLYEEGARKPRSSDSSRRTRFSNRRSGAGAWSSVANTSHLNTSLASNIQKMFNEKIEVFSPVEFSKVSILTGVVKIALKTLLECVRLRTFSRYGFQQMQVDAHYLQLYLWRFVSDENLVTFLLDEIMTSSVHRCTDPVPMENSVVDMLCDRG